MIIDAKKAESAAVVSTAQAMCAAARTAPKTKGVDYIHTCIVTGKEKDDLADEMQRLAEALGLAFFGRDADNVRASEAVVIIGTEYRQRGLNESCQYCNHKNCKECADKNGVCAYDNIDLGIALGSAASVAAHVHIDNRVMFSVGKAALSLELLGKTVVIAMGIPLSTSGKSPYFDRK